MTTLDLVLAVGDNSLHSLIDLSPMCRPARAGRDVHDVAAVV